MKCGLHLFVIFCTARSVGATDCLRLAAFNSPIELTLSEREVENLEGARSKYLKTAALEHPVSSARTELTINGQQFKVEEFLGEGGDGPVYKGSSADGRTYALKGQKDGIAHQSLRNCYENGIPTIFDESSEIDLSTGFGKYRYVRGLSVMEIRASRHINKELGGRIYEAYVRWKDRYCPTPRPSACLATNVIFDFDTRRFVLVDAY